MFWKNSAIVKAKRVWAGFSLVEIMVTIALFMLLIGLVITNTSFLHRYLVRAELDKMYNVFRYMQKSAIVSGEQQLLTFDLEKRQYSCGKKIYTLPSQVHLVRCQKLKVHQEYQESRLQIQ